MFRLLTITLLYGVLSNILLSQPIKMIERELRYPLDSIRAHQARGENWVENLDKRKNQAQVENNSEVSELKTLEVESEVHSAINPIDSDNIIISPIFQNEFTSSPELYCSIYYTKNGGNTWDKSNFITPTFGFSNVNILGGGDPVLIFDYEGRAILTWLYVFEEGNRIHTAMYWSYSNDGGKTWQEPKEPFIYHYIIDNSTRLQKLADKQWLAVNKKNEVFVSYTLIEETETSQTTDIYVKKLKSGEQSFGKEVRVSDLLSGLKQFSTITIDESQNIHIMYAELKKNGNLNLVHAISTDNGEEFYNTSYVSSLTMPQSIFDVSGSKDTVVGITTRRLYPAPMITSDNNKNSPFSNNLYAVWNANGVTKNEGRKMDVYFSVSTDNGKSWVNPRILSRELNNRPVSQFYPSIAVNSEGTIAVSYYDRNDDVNFDKHTDYVIQYSYDGGSSFTAPKKVSTMSTNFDDVGNRNGGFGIGEYNMLLMGKDWAMPVWADGREGDGKVRIYAAKVDLDTNGIEIIYSLNSNNKILNVYLDGINQSITIEKIFTKDSEYSYVLYDLQGSNILETSTFFSEIGVSDDIISLETIRPGVYFIQLKTDYGYSVAKFIKN